MSAKSRVTRKQLLKKPDEFLTLTQNLIDFCKKNQKAVLSVIGIVAICAGGYGIYFFQQASSCRQALLLEEEGNRLFSTLEIGDRFNVEPADELKKPLDKYREIIQNYPGTPSAERALIYIADCYYRLKEFDKAEKNYLQYLGKYPERGFFTMTTNQSLGYVYEAKGDYDKAIRYFIAASSDFPDEERSQTFMDVARCYEGMGKFKLAVEYYQKSIGNTSAKERGMNVRFMGGDIERIKGKIARLQSRS